MKHIYFIGIGAIGMKYAARVFDYFPDSVSVIADGKRIASFKENPPCVNGKVYDFKYIAPGEPAPAADLIFVAVKSAQLEQALNDVENFVGTQTQIVSLLNGITSEDEIAEKFGQEKTVYANVYMDAVREGHNVTYKSIGKINFGKAYNKPVSPEISRIKALFDACKIPSEVPENMLHAHWVKFALNVGINQVSAILRAPYGTFTHNIYARNLLADAAREVVAISKAANVNLNESDIDKILAIVDAVNRMGKTSMHQDVEAKRQTEVDLFALTVINLGKKYNIPTPLNNVLYRLIKAIDNENGHTS